MKKIYSHKKAVALSAAGLSVFLAHFTAVALYIAPPNPVSMALAAPVAGYIDPVFTQNWKLFAPNPSTTSQKLWVRCGGERGEEAWRDPIEGLQRKHNANRVSYRGKLLYVYRGVGTQLLNRYISAAERLGCRLEEKGCLERVDREMRLTPEYEVAGRFLKKACGVGAGRAQLRFVTVHPKQFSERLSEKPYAKMSIFDLPEFQL